MKNKRTMTSRRSNRNKKKNILLTDIKSTSICTALDLPMELCCDQCKSVREAECGLLKKMYCPQKRFRDLSDRRRCQQPRISKHRSTKSTASTQRKFIQVRNYLKIECDTEIENYYVNDSRKKIKPHEIKLISNSNKEGEMIVS